LLINKTNIEQIILCNGLELKSKNILIWLKSAITNNRPTSTRARSL
jgi:hypothetical protein